jgi:vacuolar-type H+-ATPase subunit I/STV1
MHEHDTAAGGTWFDGYGQYHTLQQCLGGDRLAVWIVVALCLSVTAGYIAIAIHWSVSRIAIMRQAPAAGAALNQLFWIFILCGCCGYLFLVVKTVWPAWRLWMMLMCFLSCVTWTYVFRVRKMVAAFVDLSADHHFVKNMRGELDLPGGTQDELLEEVKRLREQVEARLP